MALRKDGDRKTFTSTLRKDLYERLQSESERTDIPISKMLDKAVERLFEKTFTIEDKDLYSFLVIWYGTKGRNIDKEVERILTEYVAEKIKITEDSDINNVIRHLNNPTNPNKKEPSDE